MNKFTSFSVVFFLITVFANDKLWIYDNDGSFLELDISKIERITFSDFDQGDIMRINRANGSITDDSIRSVEKIRFTDWYGFVGAPQNVTISADSSTATLNWDAVDGATDYLIYRSETDPYSGFVKIDSTFTKPYLDANILEGNKYFYIIKARNYECKSQQEKK